jgi:protein TonB
VSIFSKGTRTHNRLTISRSFRRLRLFEKKHSCAKALRGGVFMSEMGSLSGCILENDPDLQGRARWLRGKSLAASVAIEATVVLGLVAWPLFSPGVLGSRLIITPVPPYSGNGEALKHSHAQEHNANTQSEPTHLCLFCSRPATPSHANRSEEGQDPAPGGAPDPGFGPGTGSGPLIPGTDGGAVMPVEIKRPEPVQHAGPQHISEGVMAAALINKVQPEYPYMAKVAHVAGEVKLRAIIGTDGKIRQLEVISGPALLQGAAVAAVRNWRYRPTMLSGVPVEVETLITVNFILNEP